MAYCGGHFFPHLSSSSIGSSSSSSLHASACDSKVPSLLQSERSSMKSPLPSSNRQQTMRSLNYPPSSSEACSWCSCSSFSSCTALMSRSLSFYPILLYKQSELRPIHSRSSDALKGSSSIFTKMFSLSLYSQNIWNWDCSPKLAVMVSREAALASSSAIACLMESSELDVRAISWASQSLLFSMSQGSLESLRSSQQSIQSSILEPCCSQTFGLMNLQMCASELRVEARMDREYSFTWDSMKYLLKLLQPDLLSSCRNSSETAWQGAQPSITVFIICPFTGASCEVQQLMYPARSGCMRLKQRTLQLMAPWYRSIPMTRSVRMPKMRYLLQQFSMQQSCSAFPDISTYCTSTLVVRMSVQPMNCPCTTQPSMGTVLKIFSSSLMNTAFSKQTTHPIYPLLVHTTSITMSVQSSRRPMFWQTSQSSRSEWMEMLFENLKRLSERYITTQEFLKGVSKIFCTFIFSCFEKTSPDWAKQTLYSWWYLYRLVATCQAMTVMVCLSSPRVRRSGSRLLCGPRKMAAWLECSLQLSMLSLLPERLTSDSTMARIMFPRQQFMRNLQRMGLSGTPFWILMGNSSGNENFGRQSILRILSPSYSSTLVKASLFQAQCLNRLRLSPSTQKKLGCHATSFLALGTKDQNDGTNCEEMTGKYILGKESTKQSRIPGWKYMKLAYQWLLIQNFSLILHLLMKSSSSSLAFPMSFSFPSFTRQKQKENSFTFPSRVNIKNLLDWLSPEQWNQARD